MQEKRNSVRHIKGPPDIPYGLSRTLLIFRTDYHALIDQCRKENQVLPEIIYMSVSCSARVYHVIRVL